jgi:hypothetical protein
MLSSHRGVIDCIFGDVFVVVARFLATEVVTLRWSRVSAIIADSGHRIATKELLRSGSPARE